MRTKFLLQTIDNIKQMNGDFVSTITKVYECICQKGRILEISSSKKSRLTQVFLSCEDCAQKYRIDVSKGPTKWRIVPTAKLYMKSK